MSKILEEAVNQMALILTEIEEVEKDLEDLRSACRALLHSDERGRGVLFDEALQMIYYRLNRK